MSTNQCSSCRETYEKGKYIPIFLDCGDTICNKCINFYKEAAKKEEFKCPICCNMTTSSNKEVKALYPKSNITNTSEHKKGPAQGEFEVRIKLLSKEIIAIKVQKEMKIDELKSKISAETGINKNELFLTFKKPLKNENTLSFYGINNTVTILQVSFEEGGSSKKNNKKLNILLY